MHGPLNLKFVYTVSNQSLLVSIFFHFHLIFIVSQCTVILHCPVLATIAPIQFVK